jgi:hypothetical protein
MNKDTWLYGINVDATLIERRDDEALPWETRALAGASVGIEPVAGLQAVIELETALTAVLRGDHAGKSALARILSATGCDYQRALWYNLAGRHPLTVASALGELRKAMNARAEMWLSAERQGLEPTTEPNPYFTDRQEGPRGSSARRSRSAASGAASPRGRSARPPRRGKNEAELSSPRPRCRSGGSAFRGDAGPRLFRQGTPAVPVPA